MRHAVFDVELIGDTFLVCIKILETEKYFAFWYDKFEDREHLYDIMTIEKDIVWISFNGIKFDLPLISAWFNQKSVDELKFICSKIIDGGITAWEAYDWAGVRVDINHIDLLEVAPGVMTSLKIYAGRMNAPSMVDLPFHHERLLTKKERLTLRNYCFNDLDVTEMLFNALEEPLTLRKQLGETYGLDLRSKSDPQTAEAILKKKLNIGSVKNTPPEFITYKLPKSIKVTHPDLRTLVKKLEEHHFLIDKQGSPVLPEWLEEPFAFFDGLYKFGIGGLHSQHDRKLYVEATEKFAISDIDAASYYPKIMISCGLTPKMGGKGERFIEEFTSLYEQRIAAKRSGNKAVAQSLKIALNGTYGKLGSIYSAFYSPELMLAICLTGQLNLLNLINALRDHCTILSANTDGITLMYEKKYAFPIIEAIVKKNEAITDFEYEYTHYKKVAMKDVNNYIIIKEDGTAKVKGIYAPPTLEKNPTAYICTLAAIEYIRDGTPPEETIHNPKADFTHFLSIRSVKGGGIQHKRINLVDDWVCVEDVGTKNNLWMRQKWLDEGRSPWDQGGEGVVRRKSRPHPIEIGSGGEPFGRVARWYMSTKKQPPITYLSSGNKVPKTDGAQLCMVLPLKKPKDIDYDWYINETYDALTDMGVPHGRENRNTD